jgi:hypothetical protein
MWFWFTTEWGALDWPLLQDPGATSPDLARSLPISPDPARSRPISPPDLACWSRLISPDLARSRMLASCLVAAV